MALRLVTGNPGSGKTYCMVNHLITTYFEYNKEKDIYTLKPEFKDLQLITNIDELALEHHNLDDILKKSGRTIKTFFTIEYQEKLHQKYPRILYIIDEAQRYFRTRFYDEAVFEYFEYLRHHGDDIYLLSQDRFRICKDIATLAETEMRAVRRSLSLAGEFKYNIMIENEIVQRKVLKPDKKIFALYKSFTVNETEKIKKPKILRYVIILAIIFPFGFWYLIHRIAPHKNTALASTRPLQTAPKKASQATTQETTHLMEIKSYFWDGKKFLFIHDPITDKNIDPNTYESKIIKKGQNYYVEASQQEYDKYLERLEKENNKMTNVNLNNIADLKTHLNN